ncbi:MAG: type II secretion system F family protein [Planctomycetota bacterium]|jgi:type IV pilus assembly protein PilC
MPRFKVLARDISGNKVQQSVEAVNQAEARAQLRSRNLTILSVVEEAVRGAPREAQQRQQGTIRYRLIGGPPHPRIKSKDLVVFTRQFATMVSAGIPLLECLDILTEQASDPGFKLILSRIVEDVRAGVDLSTSMMKHPKVFTNIYVNMIRAGEAAGQLDEILLRLAEYQESSEKLKSQIKSAMTYPVVSICLVLGITIVLLVWVIPRFEAIFENLSPQGKDGLPGVTKFVLALSAGFRNHWYIIFGVAFGIFLVIRAIKKTEKGAYGWDLLKIKLPVFGPLSKKVALSRFARTFSTLIRSGVNILGALDIVAATAGNKVLESAVVASRESIRSGEPLAKPLGESPVFPPMVVRMVEIGEKAGRLEGLLEKISQFYDDEVSSTVEQLTALIEPLMIGIMGFLVGGIVLAVFLPILKLQGQLSRT